MGTKSKALYQSELRERGRTTLRFKSDIKDGKFGPYCFVQIQGDSDDRLFNIDNGHVREEIERTRTILGDGWVHVEAEGAKSSATLRIISVEGEGPVLGGDKPTTEPPANEWAERLPAGPQPTAPAAPSYAKLDATVAATLRAVQGLEAGGVRVDSDAAARMFSTIFIQNFR